MSDEARSVERLTDPRALRALAHPIRLRLVGLLRVEGRLTATRAAELLGESNASCSFHLRQLAKYGLVEEAGGGKGRERPWRATAMFTDWPSHSDDPELAAAGDLLSSMIAERYFERLMRWLDTKPTESPEWQEAAIFGDTMLYLTDEELADLAVAQRALLDTYLERLPHPELRPPGARLISYLQLAHPVIETPPEGAPVRGAAALLRERPFRRYWAAQTISMFGDQISSVALPLTAVLVLHAGAAGTGYLTALVWVPSLLFAVHAGGWVDRRGHRRRTMIVADLGRFTLLASVPAGCAAGPLTLAQLYAVAFGVGTLSVWFTVLAGVATINFFNLMFEALFIFYVIHDLRVRPALIGLVLGAAAVGGVPGSLLARRLAARIGVGRAYLLGCALLGGTLAALIGVRPTLWIAVAGGVIGCLWLLPSPLPHFRMSSAAARAGTFEHSGRWYSS